MLCLQGHTKISRVYREIMRSQVSCQAKCLEPVYKFLYWWHFVYY